MVDDKDKNLGDSGVADDNGWPENVSEITYPSKADNTNQPAMYYSSGNSGRPLLVGLHTWSFDYKQASAPYAKWCIDNDWCFIYPNFRGPNCTPESGGSDLAVGDVVSSVDYACEQNDCDRSRIYLVGVSGGGHMALQMAGRAPEIWAGVSAWCGISDVAKWYYETKASERGYYLQIEGMCGGEPTEGSAYLEECAKRSPLTHLANAGGVPLDICAGIHDGHTGSVPVSHSIDAFNLLAEPSDRISDEQKEFFVREQSVPLELKSQLVDHLFGEKIVLFRRASKNVRLTIFEGGHEIVYPPAFDFLQRQKK